MVYKQTLRYSLTTFCTGYDMGASLESTRGCLTPP